MKKLKSVPKNARLIWTYRGEPDYALWKSRNRWILTIEFAESDIPPEIYSFATFRELVNFTRKLEDGKLIIEWLEQNANYILFDYC